MPASSTLNTHRPRLSPALWREIRIIAANKGITDSEALRGILTAGIAAMHGFHVVQMPPPSSQATQ